MMKRKTNNDIPLTQRVSQMSSVLGQWSPESSEGEEETKAKGRELVPARRGKSYGALSSTKGTFASSSSSAMSKSLVVRSPRTVDRRGRTVRADEEEGDLISNVKAFVGKQSETVDKYEEARKKSKINRFFKGVRNIFPKRKKKNKDKDKKGKQRDDRDEEEESESDEEDEEKMSRSKKKEKEKVDKEEKPREIGRGLFQEKERLKREQEQQERQRELEAARRQRAKGKSKALDDEDDDEERQNDDEEEGSTIAEKLKQRRGSLSKGQEQILKRSQSTPAAKDEQEEASKHALGWREKYRAKLEAKKMAKIAELQREETEKEINRQREAVKQAAKVENAAIDSFVARAAERRRGTEERVGYRSSASSRRQLQEEEEEERQESPAGSDYDEPKLLIRTRETRRKEKESREKEKKEKKLQQKQNGKVHTTTAPAEDAKKKERRESPDRNNKKSSQVRKREPERDGSSDSLGAIATTAAVGGAKLIGRYVQQQLGDESDQDDANQDENQVEEEPERPHRWKDRERERKVRERIEETRRQRQAQDQGRRPSLGKSYSWASPRSGDIPVPMTTTDRLLAAIDAAAVSNSPATISSSGASHPARRGGASASPSPRASPRQGETVWHRKARLIRERSQRSNSPAAFRRTPGADLT